MLESVGRRSELVRVNSICLLRKEENSPGAIVKCWCVVTGGSACHRLLPSGGAVDGCCGEWLLCVEYCCIWLCGGFVVETGPVFIWCCGVVEDLRDETCGGVVG